MSRFLGSAHWTRPLAKVGQFVATHRRDLPIRKVARLCTRYMSWYANANYDLRTNGECFVLDTLGSFAPRIIFDVGANVGEWSLEASKRCPGAAIHAFEIARPTFERLVANTSHLSCVSCQLAGLSDSEGSVPMRYYAASPSLTTSANYPHPLSFSQFAGSVITGDSYVAANGIDRIDLLKIDVEGMERQVLRGFDDMFSRRAIDLAQFEYGRVSIVNGFLLKDFHAFFRERGYMVGKIFPNYVDFREYELTDEDFVGPNYLACRNDNAAYLQAFSRRTV
jgi:FkbM family methyltransferase